MLLLNLHEKERSSFLLFIMVRYVRLLKCVRVNADTPMELISLKVCGPRAEPGIRAATQLFNAVGSEKAGMFPYC